MPAPYTLELHPVVGIVNEITTTPSETLVLTLLPVLQGASAPNYTAGEGIVIAGLNLAVDTTVIATRDYTESVSDSTLIAANTYSDIANAATLASANATTASVQDLAETNAFKIGQLQNDLDTTNQTTASNYTALDTAKADKTTVTTLQTLVDTKATPADITAAIAVLVDGAPDALNTLNEIATALQGDEATIATILTELNNRVRFDAAQSLTVPQQDQARSNIDAEKVGVAATLVAAVTTSSIGAATAAQGAKADTALQSGDVAPVALSGSFTDLINKSALFNLVYSGYVIGSNVALLATDTLGQMLGKLQGQLSANTAAISTKEPSITSGTTSQYWRGDKSWRSFATDVLATALTELSTATATAVTATDTVVSSIGKLQAQVSINSANATSFAQSTWSFSDLDVSGSGGVFVSAINAGTPSYGIGVAGTYGNVLVSSSTTANSGAYIGIPQTAAPIVGMLTRTIFTIQSAQSTRTLRGGYVSSASYSSTETNGIYWTVKDQTVTASTSKASVTTTQGSVVLPLNVVFYCDVELLTSSSARIVIFDPSTNTIYLDQLITTNIPTVGMYAISKANSSGTSVIPLCLFDYHGRGRLRPSYIIAPPYTGNIG